MRAVPRDGLLQPAPEIGGRAEPEALLRTCDIEHPPRLAIRPGGVEGQRTAEPAQLGDEMRQVPNADLEAGADVDRRRVLVALRCPGNRLRAVLDVEKLTRRAAG